ncbi:uncharacterized protein LOC141649946 [Silene latifolia]|uniref:uncharacterized protein LOC141649946 n=1 Tax=Silene latifolia TaxID=37657 RepID=UPI003D77C022
MTWAIKKIEGEHNEFFFLKKNPMATTIWMVKKLESDLKAQPNMPVNSIVDLLMLKFGIEACRRTLYKVRVVSSELIFGAHEKSYNLLPAYAEMIKSTNPGSWELTTWHSPCNDGVFNFKAMFVTYTAWIRGFLRGCRPIIGVDGCHLKGRYKGMLLSAISLDSNNNIFLVAYAIVGKEMTDTWSYFFRNLKVAFQQQGMYCY